MRPPLPGPVGRAASAMYRAAIGHINRRFDRGRGVVRFDRPVISVGNLSVGGTGKTPMVALLAQSLLEAGHRPCIAMRGYGSSGKGEESDEAAEYHRRLPDVPVVARANRTLGLIQLFASEHDEDQPSSDCILLDDGFQHRQIARDLDIVLVDATRDPFGDRLLPAGWLREPVGSLKRAGAVVLTHAESAQPADITALDRKIAAMRGRGAQAVVRHSWRGLNVTLQAVQSDEPPGWLAGKKIFAACAIGNPEPFLAAARRSAGVALAGELVLRDHNPYSPQTVERLMEGARQSRANVVLMTGKDWSKLAGVPAERWPCAVAYPELALTFDRGREDLVATVLETVARGAPE